MKRAIFFISAIIIISSFSSQLLALPEGVVARLRIKGIECERRARKDGKIFYLRILGR